MVTPDGKPLKDAIAVMRTYHSCGNLGGDVPRLLEVKSKKTDTDGYFSISTVGINIDYFALVALCFGTQVERYVCSKGKWELVKGMWGHAKDLQTNGDITIDPETARSGDLYWFDDDIPKYVKLECGQ